MKKVLILFYFIFRVLLTSVLGALFKYAKLRNYSLKKSKVSISNALITQTFIKKITT